jgi:mRNA interferase HigB
MHRTVTQKRLRAYAARHPMAKSSLLHSEKVVLAAAWRGPADVRRTFNDVDAVKVASGNTVYVFNIQRDAHRLIAAVHYNTGLVFVLRLLTHREYDLEHWKDEL